MTTPNNKAQDLTGFIEEAGGASHLRVEDDLGEGYVRLRSSEAERRQARHDIRSTEDIVIEMLRNARDAGARSIFFATSREGDKRLITIIDDGDGIPASMQQHVFEPRVTSKLDSVHMDRWGVHGRGMALFSIRSNTECAQVVSSGKGQGSAFFVRSNTRTLPEKTDQSSLPSLSFDESGNLSVRGPRNINRCAVEFALEEQDTCTLYQGSPTEIAATLLAYGQAITSQGQRAFLTDIEELSLVKRLCCAADPAEFTHLAATLGLTLSERSSRRILDGEIKPLEALTQTLDVATPQGTPPFQGCVRSPKTRDKDKRGLKLSSDDLQEFTAHITQAYQALARDYYLDPAVDPSITVRSDGITIHIPVQKVR
ncbi:MAG: ATP-binding protein [Raoultibacter sp.]